MAVNFLKKSEWRAATLQIKKRQISSRVHGNTGRVGPTSLKRQGPDGTKPYDKALKFFEEKFGIKPTSDIEVQRPDWNIPGIQKERWTKL